jgi:type II secretory pathway pseudopilin PulG
MQKQAAKTRRRRGFSFLELQVAFVLLGIALAGLGPLVVMQSRQLRMLETRFNHQTTYYVVPSADGWARKLGVCATIETQDPGPRPTTGLGVEAYINFQRPSDVEPGAFGGNHYEADAGSSFADRGNGYTYGWNADLTAETVNRCAPHAPDERYNTSVLMGGESSTAVWEIGVPNRPYKVHLAAGDPVATDSVYKIDVEGVLAVDGVPDNDNKWVHGTAVVTVTDGKLTVSNAAGAVNNKIDFIEIYPPNQVQILSLDRSLDSDEVAARVEVTSR